MVQWPCSSLASETVNDTPIPINAFAVGGGSVEQSYLYYPPMPTTVMDYLFFVFFSCLLDLVHIYNLGNFLVSYECCDS